MRTYRVSLDLGSPCLTPWHADTIFGHLCWALARRKGDAGVGDLLNQCRAGTPPLVLSDAFPTDCFPRPLFPPAALPRGSATQRSVDLREEQEAKRVNWLSEGEFARVLRGETVRPVVKQPVVQSVYTLHNQINRASGTTTGIADSGGALFALEGEYCPRRTLFVRVVEGTDLPWQELLTDLETTGFGKRKSVGYGMVRRVAIDDTFTGFGEPDNADGFVSLSRFVPSRLDPTDGFWKTEVKYGKLGEELSAQSQPFKRPLVQLAAGSVFRTVQTPAPFYGRLVEGIAPGFAAACEHGFAFAVGLKWPKQLERRT